MKGISCCSFVFFWHKHLFTRPKTYKICVYECPRVKFWWLHMRMTVLGLCPPTLCVPPHHSFGFPNSSQQHFCFRWISQEPMSVSAVNDPLFPLGRLLRKQSRIACRQCSGAYWVATNLAHSGSSRGWTKGGPGWEGSYIVHQIRECKHRAWRDVFRGTLSLLVLWFTQ